MMPDYGAYRFTRVAGPTPDAPDVYSPLQAGWVSPGKFQNTERSDLGAARDRDRSGLRQGGDLWRADPRRTCREQSGACWCWTANSKRNPSTRCFSSRKAGSPGTTRARKNLELVLGVQSPYEAAEALAYPARQSPRRRSSRRASTPSSPIWAADSADATIRPSRSMSRWRRCSSPAARSGSRTTAISSSRRASSGIAFKMRTRIGVDRATGKISAFAADHVLDGGGLANFSANVATVGAIAAIGIYDIPKVDVTTVALHSRGVTAGSMRGYGTLQTMTALEVLIDEAAAALPLDPIEFRRRNALKPGGKTMTGNPYSVSVRTPEILDKLEKHPIWQQRAEEKARGTASGICRRHRRGLRHQELRHRRGLFAGNGGNRPAGPDRHPRRSRRDGQRHRDGARQPGGDPSGRRGR